MSVQGIQILDTNQLLYWPFCSDGLLAGAFGTVGLLFGRLLSCGHFLRAFCRELLAVGFCLVGNSTKIYSYKKIFSGKLQCNYLSTFPVQPKHECESPTPSFGGNLALFFSQLWLEHRHLYVCSVYVGRLTSGRVSNLAWSPDGLV